MDLQFWVARKRLKFEGFRLIAFELYDQPDGNSSC